MNLTNLEKKGMTKKAWKETQKKKRVRVNWNTGSRTHSTPKKYNRKDKKWLTDF